jgi:hypothetical protein
MVGPRTAEQSLGRVVVNPDLLRAVYCCYACAPRAHMCAGVDVVRVVLSAAEEASAAAKRDAREEVAVAALSWASSGGVVDECTRPWVAPCAPRVGQPYQSPCSGAIPVACH